MKPPVSTSPTQSVPPFCPNPCCSYYHSPPPFRWYSRDGYYSHKDGTRIPRFSCKSCHSRFSARTFSLDIYVKHPLPYQTIYDQIICSAGIRAIARVLHVSPKVILNRCSRLARQAIAVHARLSSTFRLTEPLVTDGFESFVGSQYFPNNIHTLITADSQYWIETDYAHLRRKGRMTSFQRRKNQELPIISPGGWRTVSSSFRRIIDRVEGIVASSPLAVKLLYSDEHPSYIRPIAESGLLRREKQKGRFEHRRISSRKARTINNPLFAVNYLDRLIRKDNANHVRETMQFSREVNNCMERMAIYRMYHNYRKPYRIKERRYRTHGEEAGISRELIGEEMATLFTRRRFFLKQTLGRSDLDVWRRLYVTPKREWSGKVPRYVLT